MKRDEASKILINHFEELSKRAENVGNEDGDNEEYIKLTDCMHKLYITLSNAGAFEDEVPGSMPSGFPS